jgi:anti-sigma factor RsiW
MTGRVLRFDQAEHKVVDVLLPWFVNGTLDPDERELVQQHLRGCTACQQQVDWLRDLHAACVAGCAQGGASKAFERLRHQLEAPPARRDSKARLRSRKIAARFALPWAIAAGVTILIVLASLWGPMLDAPALYRTLGAGHTVAHGSLVVVFDPATRESELRGILRAVEARIVDGPTAQNAYVLDVAAERQDQALQALRTERAVVLAERLASGAAR